MNLDHMAGRLKQLNGRIKEQWCKMHDDKIGLVAAKRYQIAGRMQALCGIAQQESAQQLRTFKRQNHAWYPANILPMKSARVLQAQSIPLRRATEMRLVSLNTPAELIAA
ncbi:MAG: hypothetical protein ACXWIN_06390 [Burkholderiaceae bacterium]